MIQFTTESNTDNDRSVKQFIGSSNETILQTKLEIPNLTTKVLMRSRLTSLFGKPGERKLTIITAPAGYGKTTLLGEWLSISSSHNQRTAWLTLDIFDNAPFRFWFYLIAAIRNAFPALKFKVESLLTHEFESSIATSLIPLLNEIDNCPFYLNIILDDYHIIKDPMITDSLTYLIEHQPKNLHLIIASRVRPEIPMARLRTQGRLVEITAEDLAFSFEETCSYLNDSIKRQLTANEIVKIFENTEGWIAGLKMAAITSQTRNQVYTNSFTDIQNNVPFTEYFSEEVLKNLTPELQEFLLKTSLLTEFSSELCDYLLETGNSQLVIDQIRANNLFIEAINNQDTWFRYHPLFALSLNQQLQKQNPSSIIQIHKKALTWFLEKGYPEKAVIHAFQSGHEEKAAEIIASLALQAAINFDLIKLVHWINSIPENLIALRPQLGIFNALACFLLGQYDITNARLQRVEEILKNSSLIQDDPGEYDVLRWEISAVRTGIEIMAGNVEKGYRESSILLKDKSKEENYIYAMFTHFKARSLEKMGRLADALEVYETARNYGLVRNYCVGYIHSCIGIVQVLLRQGQLIKAKQECERAMDFILDKRLESATFNMTLSILLEIALQLNNMADADRLAETVLANFENTISSESVLYNHVERCVYLTNYLVRKNDLKNARLYFERALSCHHDYSLPNSPLPDVVIDTYIRLIRAEARTTEMKDWPRIALEFLDETSLNTSAGKIAHASIYLNQKNFIKAENLLVNLIQELRKSELKGSLLQTLVLYALVLSALGEKENAYAILEETFHIAYPTGSIRVFLEQGAPLRNLILEYLKMTRSKDFEVQNPGFLERLEQTLASEGAAKNDQRLQGEPMMTALHLLKEPLSEREYEVLKMLITGKTAKEIADQLMISINTTKTHIQNIYRKFGVHSQKMLINKAIELGLIK
jgi:LuxR family transcriptional regulator, maltose regulon positive regulatory protein